MGNAKSPGPKSLAGKEIISMNAFKHGLTAQKWMSEELGDYFDKILTALTKEYIPSTPTEILMVERVAITMTKIRRLNNIEDAQYQLAQRLTAQKLGRISAGNDPTLLKISPSDTTKNQVVIELHQAASIPDLSIMNLVNRHQNSLSRQLSKELSELITVIGLRKKSASVTQPKETEESQAESEWDEE